PDEPETVDEAKAHPEAFAHKMSGQVADHFAEVIGRLKKKPVVVGHSFGGLITQMLAGRGLAAVSVAIDPAPFRGVLPLPLSSLKSASPVLGNPANRGRAIALTFEQFKYGWANALGDDEAKDLYQTYHVPAAGGRLPGRHSPASSVSLSTHAMSEVAAVDVIVAGLGAHGSSAAYHLASRGASVLGFDRFGRGHTLGSSGGLSRIIRLSYYE